MDHAILIPIITLAVFSVMLLLRTPVKIQFRLATLLVLVIYGFIWKEELMAIMDVSKFFSIATWKPLLKETVNLAFNSLVWVWPITLLYAFFGSSDRDIQVNLTILMTFSVITWISYFFYL